MYQWVRLSFGDKLAPDLAINAINLLADRAQHGSPAAAKILKDHTYVDDIAGSDTSLEKVIEGTNGIDEILCNGTFAIKAWHSNSSEIDQDPSENPVSLLGHQWDKKADSIALKRETVNADLMQLLYQTKGPWPGVPAVGPVRIDGTSFNPIHNRSPESLGSWLSV